MAHTSSTYEAVECAPENCIRPLRFLINVWIIGPDSPPREEAIPMAHTVSNTAAGECAPETCNRLSHKWVLRSIRDLKDTFEPLDATLHRERKRFQWRIPLLLMRQSNAHRKTATGH
jgi:hypothetical protein